MPKCKSTELWQVERCGTALAFQTVTTSNCFHYAPVSASCSSLTLPDQSLICDNVPVYNVTRDQPVAHLLLQGLSHADQDLFADFAYFPFSDPSSCCNIPSQWPSSVSYAKLAKSVRPKKCVEIVSFQRQEKMACPSKKLKRSSNRSSTSGNMSCNSNCIVPVSKPASIRSQPQVDVVSFEDTPVLPVYNRFDCLEVSDAECIDDSDDEPSTSSPCIHTSSSKKTKPCKRRRKHKPSKQFREQSSIQLTTLKKDSTWTRPKNLGTKVNSLAWDSHPALSPGGLQKTRPCHGCDRPFSMAS